MTSFMFLFSTLEFAQTEDGKLHGIAMDDGLAVLTGGKVEFVKVDKTKPYSMGPLELKEFKAALAKTFNALAANIQSALDASDVAMSDPEHVGRGEGSGTDALKAAVDQSEPIE